LYELNVIRDDFTDSVCLIAEFKQLFSGSNDQEVANANNVCCDDGIFFSFPVYGGQGENVHYTVGGQQFEGYFISPSTNAPLVFLVHDWDGLTDYEVKRAGMLAELGYAVFCVDMYGKGVRPTERSEKKKMTKSLYADRPRMRSLLEGGLKTARGLGANLENAVAMGYCFGGTCVLELGRSGKNMKGFVAFHGGLTIPKNQDYTKAKGSYLILHGSADTAVKMSDFATLTEALEKNKINHEMITYSGAPHAFTVFGSPRYREDADKKSWARFLDFLSATLK